MWRSTAVSSRRRDHRHARASSTRGALYRGPVQGSVRGFGLPSSGSSSEERQRGESSASWPNSCPTFDRSAQAAQLPYLWRRLEPSRTDRSICATGARTRRTPVFLPEERAWLDELFDEVGYVDAFRERNPDPDHYTWWFQSRAGLGEERRLADRLPVLSPGLKGASARSTSTRRSASRPRARSPSITTCERARASRRRRPRPQREPWCRRRWVACPRRVPASSRAVAMLFLDSSRRLAVMLVFTPRCRLAARGGIGPHDDRHVVLGGARLHAQCVLLVPSVDRVKFRDRPPRVSCRRAAGLPGGPWSDRGRSALQIAHSTRTRAHLGWRLAVSRCWSRFRRDAGHRAWMPGASNRAAPGDAGRHGRAYQLGYRRLDHGRECRRAMDRGRAGFRDSLWPSWGFGRWNRRPRSFIPEPQPRVSARTIAQEQRVIDWLSAQRALPAWPAATRCWFPAPWSALLGFFSRYGTKLANLILASPRVYRLTDFTMA